jgi:hypothetical protein
MHGVNSVKLFVKISSLKQLLDYSHDMQWHSADLFHKEQ